MGRWNSKAQFLSSPFLRSTNGEVAAAQRLTEGKRATAENTTKYLKSSPTAQTNVAS
jgi:hypothetical protein